MNEAEYYQQVAAELQQGFANSLSAQAANYEGQLAMLKVQSRNEIEELKRQLAEATEETTDEVAVDSKRKK